MHREFIEGWDGRVGKEKSWDNNPYVWVIDFKRSPTTEELIKNALRYKPERIVVHEAKLTGEEMSITPPKSSIIEGACEKASKPHL